ncbi:Hypothetical predicted protein [Lecanosticta acicola]|uniref:Rhodopsin domain-containing protein n=1 Tax=Lecanosticta acicola TaxID=111012 RepID=A0AAI8Z7E5_9PEZI|nr:Hypothetical predicted protein [Lecanosticta acicola]
MAVCQPFLYKYGAGKDVVADGIGVEDIVRVGLWVYVGEPFYTVGTFSMKIAMVLLYLRMWESNTGFRKACYVTLVLLAINTIGFAVGAIFLAWPKNYYIGDSAMVRHYAHSIDIVGGFLALTGLNIAMDIWVILLPLVKLVTLRGITRSRKVGICVTFLLGFVVTACNVVRITRIVPLRNSVNFTRDIGSLALWSEVEVNLSFVTANIPALAGLWHRLTNTKRRSLRTTSGTLPSSSDSTIQMSSTTPEEPVRPESASSEDDSSGSNMNKGGVAYSAFATPPIK